MTTLGRGTRSRRWRAVLAAVRAGVLAVVLALVSALVAACGTATGTPQPAPTPDVVRPPDSRSGAVPGPPQGRPLLAVTGRIGATNAPGALRLDQAELDRLGVRTMSVDDPWAKRRITVQGCWLRDVIALARPDPAATTLHLDALDDYQVDLGMDDVSTADVFLATRTAQGVPLPVEDGGPTRVVFADDLAMRFSPDLWIWNIDTIDVR